MIQRKKYGIAILIVLLSGVLIGLLIFWWNHDRNQENEIYGQRQAGSFYSMGAWKYGRRETMPVWEELKKSSYDSLLLTSYQCRQFNLDALTWGFGVEPLPVIWKTGSTKEVCTILEQAFENMGSIKMVFLELDPRQHNQEALVKLLKEHKKTQFYIFYKPYPSEYWRMQVKQNGIVKRLLAYVELTRQLVELEYVKVFYFDNQEWMAENPHYFADGTQVSRDALFQIYSAFGSGDCQLTDAEPETIVPVLEEKTYEELSGKILFCLGDSMLGKDRNESGVSEIAAGLLHVEVYNAAISGSSASGKDFSDLTGMVDMLLDPKCYKENARTVDFAEQIPAGVATTLVQMQDVTPDYIILAYGYNDYSEGAYPYGDAGEGQVSFTDSLCENIHRLKEAYPEAEIILSTAVTSSTDLKRKYTLEMYAQAAQKVAQKEQILCLYNYETDGLTSDNLDNILSDGVHFNVAGRFLQGSRLASFIEEDQKKKNRVQEE